MNMYLSYERFIDINKYISFMHTHKALDIVSCLFTLYIIKNCFNKVNIFVKIECVTNVFIDQYH